METTFSRYIDLPPSSSSPEPPTDSSKERNTTRVTTGTSADEIIYDKPIGLPTQSEAATMADFTPAQQRVIQEIVRQAGALPC